MRRFFPWVLLIAACSQQPAAPSLTTGSFSGNGRDRLCIEGEPGNYRGGLIAYGEGDTNCSASGSIAMEAGKFALVPRGEGPCRIGLVIEGDTVRIAETAAACSYYCGPGARMDGKSFRRAQPKEAVVDLAGTPLC